MVQQHPCQTQCRHNHERNEVNEINEESVQEFSRKSPHLDPSWRVLGPTVWLKVGVFPVPDLNRSGFPLLLLGLEFGYVGWFRKKKEQKKNRRKTSIEYLLVLLIETACNRAIAIEDTQRKENVNGCSLRRNCDWCRRYWTMPGKMPGRTGPQGADCRKRVEQTEQNCRGTDAASRTVGVEKTGHGQGGE